MPLPEKLPTLVAQVYRQAPEILRRRLLECLLAPVGPLALVALAAGAFGRLLPSTRWRAPEVSLDDVRVIGADSVLELAGYLAQKCPEVFDQFGTLVADHPIGWTGLAGSLLLLALQKPRREANQPD